MTSGRAIPDSGKRTLVHRLYHQGRARRMVLMLSLVVILIITAVVAAGTGTMPITPHDVILAIVHSCTVSLHTFLQGGPPGVNAWFGTILLSVPSPANPQAELIVTGFRLPRIVLAVLTGISLAVAGTVMQSLMRNPLVSPFTLGLSSAASFGAAVAIVIGPGLFGVASLIGQDSFIACMAFLFGVASMLMVYTFSRSRGTNQATLILTGVVLSYLFSAGLMLLQYITNNEKLRQLMIWLMGGMWGATWSAVSIVLPVTAGCVVFLAAKAWDFNAMAAGDDVAKNLGINVSRLRLGGLMAATLVSSCCLAFTGIIGFVGLMAPHICRIFIGNDHRYLIPCAALCGAAILLISDTLARTVMSPIEIPVGVIMYVIGGVFFMFLIARSRGRGLY